MGETALGIEKATWGWRTPTVGMETTTLGLEITLEVCVHNLKDETSTLGLYTQIEVWTQTHG